MNEPFYYLGYLVKLEKILKAESVEIMKIDVVLSTRSTLVPKWVILHHVINWLSDEGFILGYERY